MRTREQGVQVLADKDCSISEQKRTRKPKQVIKMAKEWEPGCGYPAAANSFSFFLLDSSNCLVKYEVKSDIKQTK